MVTTDRRLDQALSFGVSAREERQQAMARVHAKRIGRLVRHWRRRLMTTMAGDSLAHHRAKFLLRHSLKTIS